MQHQVLEATKSTQEGPVPAIPPAGGTSEQELQPFSPRPGLQQGRGSCSLELGTALLDSLLECCTAVPGITLSVKPF